MVFLIGIAAGFERPALVAFETQVIPIEHASRGASLTASAWTAAAIVGPAAGGLAIAFIGIPATYVALAVLLGISVLLITRIERKPMPAPEQSESIVESLTGGVKYVVGHQVLLASMALDLFAVFFGGAMAMLPVFASDILGVGPAGLGLLRTAPSAGALLAMLFTTRFPPKLHAGRILLVCVGFFGVSMIVFGLSTSFVLSLLALFAAGLVDGVSMVIRLVILRVESPEALRGRIASVNHVFIGASNELGAFESGVAATLMGVVPSVILGGVVTLVVVGGVALFAPQLRRLDLGKRLVEGPGAQPMAVGVSGSNIAAAEVDPGLEPTLDAIEQHDRGRAARLTNGSAVAVLVVVHAVVHAVVRVHVVRHIVFAHVVRGHSVVVQSSFMSSFMSIDSVAPECEMVTSTPVVPSPLSVSQAMPE